MAYKREYCCANCGLIWFKENALGYKTHITECPECNHNNRTTGDIYAVDTMGYFYAAKAIEEDLRNRNKAIHYDKEHPYYEKNKIQSC